MARTPLLRPVRPRRPGLPSLRSLTRSLATLALAAGLSGSLLGCAGGGFSRADPLTPQADAARRGVPQPAQVPREFSKTLLPTYRLAPGDTVLVEPARFDTPLRFPADQPVQPDGTIDLGRFGRVAVAGMSVDEVEELVAFHIARVAEEDESLAEAIEQDPSGAEVNVRLIDPKGSVYYVLGAVQTPGVFQLAGRETVLDAILTAGGLTDDAKKCDIILSRPSIPADCRTVLPVCYDHLVQSGDSTTNYQILPGDRIFVPKRGCKDTMSDLCGTLCGNETGGCDLCRCHPQWGCGPDAKPCPTPTRYAAMCPDAAGVRTMDLPGPGELAAPPAPAPARGDDGLNDDGPVPAPAPEPLDVPTTDEPTTDEPAVDEPAVEPSVAPEPPTTPEPPGDDTLLPPEIPDLPDLDDLAVGRAALPAAPAWDSQLPTLELETR